MSQLVDDLLTATSELQRPLPVMPAATADLSAAQPQSILTADNPWQHRNRGDVIMDAQTGQVTLTSPTRYDSWPAGAPSDGDYIQYGDITAFLSFDHVDWTHSNYLRLTVTADCQNVINPNITVAFKNDGQIKVPDKYNREGFHAINLLPTGTHQYELNIGELPREAITELSITTTANGSYLDLPGQIKITVNDVQLLQAQTSRHSLGWQLPQGQFSQTQVGFMPQRRKQVLVPAEDQATTFEIIDGQQQTVYHGALTQPTGPLAVNNLVADFTEFQQPGQYRLRVNEFISAPFAIAPRAELWGSTVLKTLNFIFAERCGYPVPGIHGMCHVDVTASHRGKTISFNGGWHDAGDLSQQTVHSGEITLSLLESATAYASSNPRLAHRLKQEALWGLDFILKMRFGDGYRATSAGVSRWTNNQIGDMDDAQARVHNNPYENYLFAGIFAKCARLIADDAWRERLTAVAQADFTFAEQVFAKHPYQAEPIMWEHTYNTSPSVYNATVAWAAGELYRLTQQTSYLQTSVHFGDLLVAAQEQAGLPLLAGGELRGFFYRDARHQVVQHFNHQAREHLISAALTTLMHNQPQQTKWQTSVQLYASYFKFLQPYTAPYPMMAAGVYLDDEYQDSASFYKQNLLVDQSAELEFQQQLRSATQIGQHLYLKRFPVWFSFRGNNGVLLSMGDAAANLGQALHDSELTQIGINQLQWLTGDNPFSQSLIYGVGKTFESQYSVSSGEMVGEIPVGIETKANEDQPYWPQFNNATYKEVWISNAGKVLSLIARILQTEGE
ncbi:glycoside hydrolase family 9 protein [Lactiplantibacillus fabifermentans]|uniref:Cellulase Ig-like domain-containing protein n=2 Tax=Lactiplantibacillus fabifermentans TaxID=483011 RepID=A0A0R2NPU5_9LACO|nr:glycoside hydrolase family 9 protein [Lactiplantibacillus fabifermentans]ETY72991.1 hypothetical protein LFAB_14420 [Lactiplantibacillus fabifermentans T30PCM01]KRO27669.1 hypothetical protein DY78_GL003033 [Lactiplantibacillus fabifermentans DSM 21115]